MESIVLQEANAPRRLLVAFAHPDDESFGPAGTLVHYASQGVAVHYVCATRGEAGDADPERVEGYESIAELRTKELLCAARHLGLAAVHFLDYRDSGMEGARENQHPGSLKQAALEEVTAKITGLMRQIRPQVVLTHDPTGGYFHPDHVKMHEAASLAFHSAGSPDRFPDQLAVGLTPYQPQKLYYTAFPRRLVKLFAGVLPLFGQDPEAFGRNNDINIRRMAEVDQVVTTKIGIRPYYRTSQQAAACHASQTGGRSGWVIDLMGWLVRFDTFSRAVPPFEHGGFERDLFAGVEDG
jgi:LmbE family N-acetylglucosaminyl deacetylase